MIRRICLGLLVISMASSLFAMDKKPEILLSEKEEKEKAEEERPKYELKPVYELPYGSILFQHFQDSSFKAITEILIAREKESIVQHDEEIDALQGRLYFRYGLLNRSEQLLTGLLERPILQSTRSEVYFLLAKARYQVGDFNRAEQYISELTINENHAFVDDWYLLKANILMRKSQYQEAAKALSLIPKTSPLAAYGAYNHGIALLGAERFDEAVAMLETIFHLPTFDEISKSLVDKTALALGYYHLQKKNNEAARRVLFSVRTKGPFVAKALLGIGWTYLNEKAYEKALVPWLRLMDMDRRDSAVQEGLLAAPFAYQELGAMQLALDGYMRAAITFGDEYDRLGRVLNEVSQGKLIPVLKKVVKEKNGILKKRWENQPLNITASAENYYLKELFANYRFHTAFREYQDIRHLKLVLEHWRQQIPIFLQMIASNKAFYGSKQPIVKKTLSDLKEKDMQEALAELRDIYRRAIRVDDAETFANATEKKHIEMIVDMQKRLKSMEASGSSEVDEKKAKLRFLQGNLFWKLQTRYLERRWAVKKSLQKTEAAMAELRWRKQRLEESHEFAQTRFLGFDQRLLENRQQLQRLSQLLSQLNEKYEKKLTQMALDELKRRQQIIRQYQLQTDLAIARLHDRALNQQYDDEPKTAPAQKPDAQSKKPEVQGDDTNSDAVTPVKDEAEEENEGER